MRNVVGIFILGLGISISAHAAEHYIRSGAPAGGNGNSWTAAWQDLPSTLVRGDTYWIADGDYGSWTLDDNASGSTYIYIKKATNADHGSAPDWNSQYGDGLAVLKPIVFAEPPSGNGGYYDINGYSKGLPRDIGIKITNGAVDDTLIEYGYWDTGNHPYCNYRYLELAGPYGSGDFDSGNPPNSYGIYLHGNDGSHDTSHTLVSHCYIHGVNTVFQDNSGNNHMIVEYCDIRDSREVGVDHGNIYWVASSYGTFRYNRIHNYNMEGLYFGGQTTDWAIYGNVFYGGTYYARGIEFRQTQTGTKIYNNTFVNLPLPAVRVMADAGAVSGVEVKNNLLVNTTISLENDGIGVTLANNINATTSVFPGFSTEDFRLGNPTSPGTALPSPYDKDPDGNTRGTYGVWDVGAYEYVDGGPQPTPTPSPTPTSTVFYLNSNTGNDTTGDGSQAKPWKEFVTALGKLRSGDTLNCTGSWTITSVYTHTIPNVTLQGGGVSTLTIRPSETGGTLKFNGSGTVFKGFDIKAPYAPTGEAHALIGFYGNNSVVSDCTIRDYAPINIYDAVIFVVSANDCLFSNLSFTNMPDRDLFRVWGQRNKWTSCTFTNCTNPGDGPHADIWQTWWTGAEVWNNVIENCTFTDVTQAVFQLKGTSDNINCHPGQEGLWSIRNNIFNRCRSWPVISTDKFRFYNNLLYQSGTGQYPLFLVSDPCNTNGRYYNNVLVNTYSETGSAPSTGGNAFTVSDSMWGGSGNFVTTEAAIKFVNAAAGNFRLQAGSSLIGKGANLSTDPSMSVLDADGKSRPSTGAWDIGPYQFGGVVTNTSHPADSNTDYLMSLNEATSFAACWKTNCNANATLDNAVRAGTLWAATNDGRYQYNSSISCPSCWEIKP